MNQLLKRVKEADQDFEWYPTTDEIIECVKNDFRSTDYDYRHSSVRDIGSILDIGAGDGRVLEKLGIHKKYAIEKSKVLIDALPEDIYVIGTDFQQQTLIDKAVDVIFCNPPYSEFESWATKIVREANCVAVYLVIPERWEQSKQIQEAINSRAGKSKIIGKFDFLKAERAARAKVHIIRIKIGSRGNGNIYPKTDPFEIWFNDTFRISVTKTMSALDAEKLEKKKQEKSENKESGQLVKGNDLVQRLETLYQQDMDRLVRNYKALESLDGELFTELKVDLKGIREGLKMKIKGLKNLYWKELFDNMQTITSRLTSGSRKKLLDTLTEHTQVDFTVSNAYAIILWAIKNANKHMDEQLLDLYYKFSEKENVINFKSNHRIIDDNWRYVRNGEHKNYYLDYRIIKQCWNMYSEWDFENVNGIHQNTYYLFQDIFTIAKNLGMDVGQELSEKQWAPGVKHEFYYGDKLFCDIKIFKKGTAHFRFCPEFMKRFNIEAARLNGWIKSPRDAADEMDVTFEEAQSMFKGNFQLGKESVKLIA